MNASKKSAAFYLIYKRVILMANHEHVEIDGLVKSDHELKYLGVQKIVKKQKKKVFKILIKSYELRCVR